MPSLNKEVFKVFPALENLETKVQETLLTVAEFKQVDRNTILYHAGEVPTAVYGIISGYVKLYRKSKERLQVLALLGRGDYFGIESLSDAGESSYTTACQTECNLLLFPAKSLEPFLVQYPSLRALMLQLTTERLRQFASLVHNLAFRDVSARIAHILLLRAEIDGIAHEDGILIPRILTQSEIATMAGTGREVVLRTLKKFEQEFILKVSRKEMIILDLPRLQAIAVEENR